MFSMSTCTYCMRAKGTIDSVGKNIPAYTGIVFIHVDLLGAFGEDVITYLGNSTGSTSVPNIFIGGNCVGGSQEVALLAESGELHRKMVAALNSHGYR